MAYGDRASVASDTFDSAIDASWDNGEGDFSAFVWVAGGTINPGDAAGSGMRRNTGTYANDQYSQFVFSGTATPTAASCFSGAAVRCASGAADESRYYCGEGEFDAFIDEVDAAFTFTRLATIGSLGLSAGHTVTCEVEGSTIRFGTTQGGADTLRTETTDNTLTSGRPGIVGGDTAAQVSITSWDGGDLRFSMMLYYYNRMIQGF